MTRAKVDYRKTEMKTRRVGKMLLDIGYGHVNGVPRVEKDDFDGACDLMNLMMNGDYEAVTLTAVDTLATVRYLKRAFQLMIENQTPTSEEFYKKHLQESIEIGSARLEQIKLQKKIYEVVARNLLIAADDMEYLLKMVELGSEK